MGFVTKYVQDTSTWDDWHVDYKFGVVLIFPPEPVRSVVNALRATHDAKTQAICDAHISLTVPLPKELTVHECDELAAIVAGFDQFRVRYGPLRHYLPAPGVCFAIEPQQQLDDLRRALEAAPTFHGAAPRPYPFSAHMTIAEYISVEKTTELMSELKDVVPRGDFLCTSVSLAVPDETFHFDERRDFPLAG